MHDLKMFHQCIAIAVHLLVGTWQLLTSPLAHDFSGFLCWGTGANDMYPWILVSSFAASGFILVFRDCLMEVWIQFSGISKGWWL